MINVFNDVKNKSKLLISEIDKHILQPWSHFSEKSAKNFSPNTGWLGIWSMLWAK
jgi:hypothetical protein